MNLFEYMIEAPKMAIFLTSLASFTLIMMVCCYNPRDTDDKSKKRGSKP